MVPSSTAPAVAGGQVERPEFRASLGGALARCQASDTADQSDAVFGGACRGRAEVFPLAPLIEELQEARKYQPVKAAQLKYEPWQPIV